MVKYNDTLSFESKLEYSKKLLTKSQTLSILRLMILRNSSSKNILVDLSIFSSVKDSYFVDRVKSNTMRYVSIFSAVIDLNMP